MQTPWGQSQTAEKLANGIIGYSTSSHGGIWLSPERTAQLPQGIDNFLHDLRWWEEDCDWAVPYIVFQADIKAYGKAYKFEENLAAAYATVQRYHPELVPAT